MFATLKEPLCRQSAVDQAVQELHTALETRQAKYTWLDRSCLDKMQKVEQLLTSNDSQLSVIQKRILLSDLKGRCVQMEHPPWYVRAFCTFFSGAYNLRAYSGTASWNAASNIREKLLKQIDVTLTYTLQSNGCIMESASDEKNSSAARDRFTNIKINCAGQPWNNFIVNESARMSLLRAHCVEKVSVENMHPNSSWNQNAVLSFIAMLPASCRHIQIADKNTTEYPESVDYLGAKWQRSIEGNSVIYTKVPNNIR